ncbi:hypothetical protein [Solitalea lacus]|uniref:hypothetical protein n=1 Tax=Solitalea lacus TaxID=2911172 RepID=UPI001EDC7B2B|nr:hypothetical protein [Solitalea lacus]UKJ06462.1 hypothetical protein L2B55_13060 [Solitalea lacus]
MKPIITAIIFFLSINLFSTVKAQGENQTIIDKFKLVEVDGNLKVVALGNDESISRRIIGVHSFVVNGLDVPLKFTAGEAPVNQKFSGSTFAYIYPQAKSIGSIRLYYLFHFGDSYWPFNIPIALLLIIPLAFFIIGYFIRKLFVLLIGIVVAVFVFSSGLSPGNYTEVVWNWLVTLF